MPALKCQDLYKVPATFEASTSYPLHNSWILDSGATIHICNDRSKFRTFTPQDSKRIYAGATLQQPLGVGSVSLTLDVTNEITRELTLHEVYYIPGFHTNVVSFDKL